MPSKTRSIQHIDHCGSPLPLLSYRLIIIIHWGSSILLSHIVLFSISIIVVLTIQHINHCGSPLLSHSAYQSLWLFLLIVSFSISIIVVLPSYCLIQHINHCGSSLVLSHSAYQSLWFFLIVAFSISILLMSQPGRNVLLLFQ